MREPTRYIGSGGLKAKLLASAKGDRPPAGSRSRAMLAAAAAAAAGTKAASATATLSATSTIGRWALLKWIAVGALGAGTVVAAKAVVLPAPDTTTMSAPQAIASSAPPVHARKEGMPGAPAPRDSASSEAPSSPLPAAPSEPASAPNVDDSRVATAAVTVAPHAAPMHVEAPKSDARSERPQSRPEAPLVAARSDDSSAPQSSTPPSSSSKLASEIAAIDQAKRALASGDATEALRRVDAYRAEFPTGTLAAEATALRIEALARTGRLDDARGELARLRASQPQSPLLENLVHLVGE